MSTFNNQLEFLLLHLTNYGISGANNLHWHHICSPGTVVPFIKTFEGLFLLTFKNLLLSTKLTP